jgi:hypothetical protein
VSPFSFRPSKPFRPITARPRLTSPRPLTSGPHPSSPSLRRRTEPEAARVRTAPRARAAPRPGPHAKAASRGL